MGRQTPVERVHHEPRAPAWSPSTRATFRFCFVYFGLYCLATQVAGGMLLFPPFALPALGVRWPMRQITLWCATHIFGVTSSLVYTGNSGDTAFFWVQTGWLLVFALVATGVWSALDRRRERYVTLQKWFRLFIRLGLAGQMFYYGMAKIIPTQFPAPSLVTLVEPVGNLSLTDMLWTSIGASTSYQMFTGWAELVGGLLLLAPRTTMLGALICLADMVQVFVLNMTYDFGLKQISFHYILMAVFLLAPDLPRLANVFLLNRPAGPSAEPPLFRTRRANRIALAAQIVFGLYLVAMHTRISWTYWNAEGGSAKSPLYGIWNIDQLSIDGQLRSPLLNDYDRRWRRVIFDSANSMAFQRTDDSFAHYGVSVDVNGHVIALTKGDSVTWESHFTFERPAWDQLILSGTMDNYKIHMQLQLVELDTFRLLNSGFRWIRPPDPSGG